METRPRRIGIIAANDFPHWGGSEDLWIATALELALQGVEVYATVPRFADGFRGIDALRTAGVRLTFRRYERWNPWWRRRYRREGEKLFYRWIEAVDADLYLISQGDNFDGMHWGKACLEARRRYVLLSELAREWAWLENSRYGRATEVYRAAVRALFVSRRNLELTEMELGMPLPNGEVVWNPFRVSFDNNLDWPTEAEAWRIACVGRIDVASKGQDVLMEIFSRPQWRQRNLRVSLYGDGHHRRSLERLRGLLGADRVEFAGFSKSPEEIWRTHHALVLPSRQEGLPLALVEAMLCGRFGIVSDVGGSAELVEDGVTGFLAQGWQPDLFDRALERAWEVRGEWKALGRAAREKARTTVPRHPEKLLAAKLLEWEGSK